VLHASSSPAPALEPVEAPPFDLLRVPVLGPFLTRKHARTLAQIPLLLVSVVMVLHGLFGPSLAPKNLATTLTWLHFRGLLMVVLLGAGNFFCFACPFMAVRNAARRFVHPWLSWPRSLRNKWLSITLLVAFLFVYELYDLWASPWWTAWLIVGYFATALMVDSVFKHATFCKFVCPIGQFNFVASLLSPLEVKVRDQAICSGCAT
jgi:polyferredoxin